MTELPVIHIRPTDSGWLAQCQGCGWAIWARTRPPADQDAIQHRRRCRRKD